MPSQPAVANKAGGAKRRLRFTIRDALAATMLLTLAFGWNASHRQAQREHAQLVRRLAYIEAENSWAKDRAEIFEDAKRRRTTAGPLLHAVDLTGANLRGLNIRGDDIAFQLAIFNKADLSKATLTGSFQGAQFTGANLAGAKLTGGGSSFQLSSFAGADLTGATLTGGGSSFQASTFQGAKLIGARINCSGASFQAVNIDDAQFQGADLSALDPGSLESCHFNTPPTYDDKTRFPNGFDPAAQGWNRIP
jgi:uncharacterized protein YjbI with pentapeptide repeats